MSEEEEVHWPVFHHYWVSPTKWDVKTDIRERVVVHRDMWVKFTCPVCDHEQDWRNLVSPSRSEFSEIGTTSESWVFSCGKCNVYAELTVRYDEDGNYEIDHIDTLGKWT